MSVKRPNEAIAIIGTGLRLPGGANTPTKLWELLREPRDVQRTVPSDRFDPDGFHDPTQRQRGTGCTRHSYFLSEDPKVFDADFFGIKPVEANSMDPQQRILLEVIYEGLEAAGLPLDSLRGSLTAVYVGLMAVDYNDMLNRDPSDYPQYAAGGTSRSMISNRVSYFFDWRGPSMTIDTACSSSLVAVHQAVQSLRSGESQVAVAAGANLLLGPETFIAGSYMNMLSPDGRSYMWDSRANGYARGEGFAAIIMKTLSAAIADGDDIECVIAETAVNQDGRTKSLTVPSAAAQTSLIQTTYAKAGLDLTKPSDRPQYFEAHGTGTPAGDPIEAQAIQDAFFKCDEHRPALDTLYCGSVKTVIGHTEGTAGLAGLIKASLAIKNSTIPPNLLFESLAPAVEPFYKGLKIPTAAMPWPALETGSVRRASVNSFGFGGTNVHCILESYATTKTDLTVLSTPYHPFVFSATSKKTLFMVLDSYMTYLSTQTTVDLKDLSHTLCVRRTSHPFRVSLSARDIEELRVKLESILQGGNFSPTTPAPPLPMPVRILGIFTGQGAQWPAMARALMQSQAAAQIIDSLEHSLATLQDPPSWSLKAELSADSSLSRVTEPAIAQPACTAVQILLVEILRAAGIRFSTVVGHSSGEIAAAYAAGRLSSKDAIRIAYYRGVHLPLVGGKNGEKGAMIAIGASYEEAQEICEMEQFRGKICVAACNSAASTTLSGDITAVEAVKEMLHAQNKFARLLRVDNAYHSSHMIRCSEAIIESLRACGINSERLPRSDCVWISSVDVKPVSHSLDHIDYWHRNTIGCVFFSQALTEALSRSTFRLAIEVGAHPALKGPALQVMQNFLGRTIPYTGILSRRVNDVQACSDGLGYIWANLRESVVDFAGFSWFMNTSSPSEVLKNLPPYPWNHERTFWYESRISRAYRHRKAHHELLGIKTPDYSEDRMAWKHYIGPKELPWLSGHRIQGQLVFPGSGYIVSAFEAAHQITTGQPIRCIELTNFQFGQALVFDSEDRFVEVLISLNSVKRHKSTVTANFTYHSAVNKDLGAMALNAECQLHIELGFAVEYCAKYPEQHFGMTEVNQEQIYSSLTNCGYHYTAPFKALHSVQRRSGVATGLIQTSELPAAIRLLIHPAALDAAMHSIAVASSYPGDGRLKSVMLPVEIAKIAMYPDALITNPDTQQFRFKSYSRGDGSRAEGDVDLLSLDGAASILRLEGLRTKPLVAATPADDIPLFSETVWGPAFPTVSSISRSANGRFASHQTGFEDVVALAQQISHRFPSLRILGLGTNAGNATKRLLLELGNAYGCYTCTDTSEKSLDCARDILEPHVDRITYKVIDIDSDTTIQGYIDASYDLVLTFSATDSISRLNRTLKIARKLLKPGGYFLSPQLLDVEPRIPMHHDVIGGKEHRRRDSMASPSSDAIWAQTLEECSFADADLSAESKRNSLPRYNAILLQALDSRMRFLRSPFSSPKQGLDSLEVTLIGGTKSSTFACSSGIVKLLQAHGSRVSQLETISKLAEDRLLPGGNMLVLQDHDQPLFENLDEPTFEGLKKLLEGSKNILWVTHGYKDNSPHARMLVGFMRSLILEMPHVRLQILDLASPDALDATLVTEHLLRLVVTGRWEDENYLADILWSIEPEIACEDNQYFIPRVKLNKLMNDRHNSASRLIDLPVDPLEVPVTVVTDGDLYSAEVRKMDRPAQIADTEDRITVRVTHSFLKAVKGTRSGTYFLVLGIDVKSEKQVIALSNTLCSIVEVTSKLVRACDLPLTKALSHYRALFYSLVAQNILHSVAQGQSLLVLEPSRDLANVLATLAAAQDIETMFWTTTDIPRPDDNGSTWKRMPTHASKRDLVSALPRSTLSHVISWRENRWATNLRDMIPGGVPINSLGSYIADCGATVCSMRTEPEAAVILDRVQNWLAGTEATLELANEKPTLLADLHTLRPATDGFNILDWSTSSTIPTRLKPTYQQTLFHPGKAYWLVGLTGDLGLSLCQWMISRGATRIVLSSRNPSIDDRWLAHFEGLGAVVKVLCCDITDYSSMQATRDQIKASIGPIAGVCHGAMVLHDALFLDLDLAKVQEVFKPKVDGAINLDKVFHNEKLDFFVMLSSIAAVTGNPGQSAYAASNGFLSALAAQRRKRGDVASCVALGAILGCGYVTRGLTLAQQESLQKAGVMWTSEQDFHSAFAEAVVTSSPHSGSSGDFTTGVRVCYTDENYKPKHASNPVFSHLLLQRDIYGGQSAADLSTTSVKAQLLVASTEEETTQVLESWLSSKLRKALQMPADATIIEKTAEALGIDSLIAIEVKSWLMKELDVGMPILTIIGGATMRELVVRCIEVLDPAMTPYNKPKTDRKTLVEEDPATNLERVSQGLSKRTATSDKAEQALTDRTKPTSTDSTTYQKAVNPELSANVVPAKALTVKPFDDDSEEKKTAIERNFSTEVAGLVHRTKPDTSNDASKGTYHPPQLSFGSKISSKATSSCSGGEQTRLSHQPEAKDNNISIRRVPETVSKSRLVKIRRILSKRLRMG